jgi:hypothetical protein
MAAFSAMAAAASSSSSSSLLLRLCLAAVALLALASAPRPAASRPLRDPNNPIPKPHSYHAAMEYHAETQNPYPVQSREQGGGNYAVAGGASSRDGFAASATGAGVGALWPQAMANAYRTGGGAYSGPYGGYGGGMYGRNGFYYGRDRTNWPNHSAGSMAVAGGQTAAIASTGKAHAAAFGG